MLGTRQIERKPVFERVVGVSLPTIENCVSRKRKGRGLRLRLRSVGKSSRLSISPVLTALMAIALGSASNGRGAQSPTGTLRGATTAVNPQGQPLTVAGVSLKLRGMPPSSASFSTFSDNDGNYELVDLAGGPYTLEASLQGFKTVVKSVTVPTGQTAVENIQLEVEELHQQVEVRESAPEVAQQSVSPPSKLSAPQLIALPIAQQKFKQALPLTPGVVRTPDGKINIKGAVENQGMLLLDGAENVDPTTGSFSIDLSIDAIQSLEVYKTPYRAEYGGFSGGLTSIQTKPPSERWHYGLNDFVPGLRGKNGHIVGISDDEPRFSFSGPLWANKLSISEFFIYDLRKQPVRGLPWPHNETKREGYNSFTEFQYIVSPRHLMTMDVQLFPVKQQFANISSLVPQSASSNLGQRGFSIGATDRYVLASGGVITTLFKYTRYSTYAHGQGPSDMLITPNGWGGNFFNAWTRTTNQEEVLQNLQLPLKEWRGRHELKVGGDIIHRSFDGTSHSHRVALLRPDGSTAEQIDFLGATPGQAGSASTSLAAKNTEVGVFAQDHWALNHQLALDLGLRYSGQTLGESANFAPRLGLIYSPDRSGATIVRGGIGVFHDRVGLLAGDFTRNPARVVSFFDERGAVAGAPLTFSNRCAKASDSGPRFVPSCSDLGSTPYNVTWNVEVDRELPRHMALRLDYLSSRTYDLSVVDPRLLPDAGPALLLSNTGALRYHEFESTLRFHPTERGELNISYVHSRARGDLNTLSDIFVPFEQPVIRPNVYASLPSDVPDRLVSWGLFKLPRKLTFSPVVDYHSGFQYSNVDVLQNYVGRPNSLRFPNFFSFDWRLFREFPIPSFVPGLRNHKVRVGFWMNNTANHSNPSDVFNNVASPNFGHLLGFQHRVDGLVLDFVE